MGSPTRKSDKARSRAVHGVTIGILILDTGFQRLPGDIGYGGTWRFPVQYAVVRGAPQDGVFAASDERTLTLFLRAVDELVALGVDGITTSCGFLAVWHRRFVAHSPVPVATSSLLQIPLVQSLLPANKRVGVLTWSKEHLTPEHFIAVGAPTDLPVGDLPLDAAFNRNMALGNPAVDRAVQECEVLVAVDRLLSAHPEIGAIVSECTNLPPYSATIERTFDVPVYDIVTLVEWFQSGLRPRRYKRAD